MRTSFGCSTTVKREDLSVGMAPALAPRRPAGATSEWTVPSASGSAGVSVTTVSPSLHPNEAATSGPPSSRSTRPASTEARSIGWLKVTTTGLSGSTHFVPSGGLKPLIAGWMVAKLHAKSDSRTPSAAELSPAGMRTRYCVLGSSPSLGVKR